MNVKITRLSEAKEIYTEERCFIQEICNSEEEPALSVARARVEPGVTTEWHRLLNTSERYLISQGTGLMELGGSLPTEVSEGDFIQIPPSVDQRITNTGNQDLIFYAICTPRFLPEHYISGNGEAS